MRSRKKSVYLEKFIDLINIRRPEIIVNFLDSPWLQFPILAFLSATLQIEMLEHDFYLRLLFAQNVLRSFDQGTSFHSDDLKHSRNLCRSCFSLIITGPEFTVPSTKACFQIARILQTISGAILPL